MAKEDKRHNWRRGKYDWDKWTNGSTWTIVKGVDFDCGLVSMRQRLYIVARQIKKRVRLETLFSEVAIRFQFYNAGDER